MRGQWRRAWPDPERLGNEAGGAEIHQRRMRLDRRQRRRRRQGRSDIGAQDTWARKIPDAGHGQVQQDEVDLPAAFEKLGDILDDPASTISTSSNRPGGLPKPRETAGGHPQ
jgi:hypothetical protein